MSAFIVDRTHIDALVRAGLNHSHGSGHLRWFTVSDGEVSRENYDDVVRVLDHTSADRVGDMLLRENVRSVSYRYPDNGPLPGPIDEYWLEPYSYRPLGLTPEPVEALKAVICFEYQSCEHPEWHASEAKAFCAALTRHLIPHLPGYDDARWEWTAAA